MHVLVKRSIGVTFFFATLIGSFLWGVYYARNTPYEKILTQDERGYISQSLVKVMNGPDSLPYAIWYKDYLYTPDTAMYQLVMFSK
jgi:hypothetical protein